MKPSEKLFYEDDKCIITRDKWNYIVRPKPLPNNTKDLYKQATYITDPNNLLWELCDCREFFDISSKEAMTIAKLTKRA